MKVRAALTLAVLTAGCRGSATPPVPVSAGIPAAAPASLGFDSTRLAGAVGYLRAAADSGAFPGAVLAVGRHGRLALLAPVGVYAVSDRRPVQAGTIYDLASLTKVVALTTACMLLVDEGKLALDAPVRSYLHDFALHDPAASATVTTRDLLTHRSGLPRHDLFWYQAPFSRDELYHRLRFLEPSGPPHAR